MGALLFHPEFYKVAVSFAGVSVRSSHGGRNVTWELVEAMLAAGSLRLQNAVL
jgi:S-formylglutathione hydrolase FrmB